MHIVVVDDHPIVLDGTKSILESVEGWHVTAMSDVVGAVEEICSLAPDLIVLDINLGTISGIHIAAQIKARLPIPIILYSGYEIEDYYELLLSQKVDGLLSKTSSKDVLLATIEATLRGDVYVNRSFLSYISKHKNTVASLDLSEREVTILQLIAQGETNKAIASTLSVSQRTIESNLTKIFTKLDVDSRAQAVHRAKSMHVID